MRVTRVLCMAQHVGRLKDAAWQRWRQRKVVDDGVEQKLKEAGITVVDARDFVSDLSPLTTVDPDSLPDIEPVFPQPPKEDQTHPNWHEQVCKVFDMECFPMEGVNQAQAFTKSVQIKKGLPDTVLELGHFTKLDDQDAQIERIIRHAFLWDAHLDKLPKLRDLDIPTHGFPVNYGIKAEISNKLLIRNLLRLCESKFPTLTGKRVIAGQHDLRVNLERHDFPVQFKISPMVTLLSKDLLQPVNPSVDVTTTVEQPNIYPFNSLIHFENKNIYEKTDFLPFKEECPFPYIHTTAFSHQIPGAFTHIRPRWNMDRFAGCTVLYGFVTALLMARRKFGEDVKVLPEPVTTQVIHFTGKQFQFAVFQLNTLDLENSAADSVKNILWLTESMNLFDKCKYDKGKSRFEGYNSEVFKYLMGLYAHGASLS